MMYMYVDSNGYISGYISGQFCHCPCSRSKKMPRNSLLQLLPPVVLASVVLK